MNLIQSGDIEAFAIDITPFEMIPLWKSVIFNQTELLYHPNYSISFKSLHFTRPKQFSMGFVSATLCYLENSRDMNKQRVCFNLYGFDVSVSEMWHSSSFVQFQEKSHTTNRTAALAFGIALFDIVLCWPSFKHIYFDVVGGIFWKKKRKVWVIEWQAF